MNRPPSARVSGPPLVVGDEKTSDLAREIDVGNLDVIVPVLGRPVVARVG